jgi:hypothetical protein
MVPASWAAAIRIRIAAVDRDAGNAAADTAVEGTVVADIAVAADKAASVETTVEVEVVAVDSS